MSEDELIAFKYSAGGAARTMPAYSDGTTPTLVTEKPPAVAMTQFGDEVAGTLTARYNSSPCADRGQNVVAAPAVAFKMRGGADTYVKHDGKIGTAGKGALTSDELAFTIAATQDQTLFQPTFGIQDQTTPKVSEDVMLTLVHGGDGGTHQQVATPDADGYVVRRLTPTECERLQGFPDGWTDIGDWVDSKGKARKTTDGNRYKALGNSFAVPVVRWLGERIEQVSEGRTDGAAAL